MSSPLESNQNDPWACLASIGQGNRPHLDGGMARLLSSPAEDSEGRKVLWWPQLATERCLDDVCVWQVGVGGRWPPNQWQ